MAAERKYRIVKAAGREGKMRRKLKLAITALVLVFSLNLMQPVSAAIDDGACF